MSSLLDIPCITSPDSPSGLGIIDASDFPKIVRKRHLVDNILVVFTISGIWSRSNPAAQSIKCSSDRLLGKSDFCTLYR